jgi:hypothetical protein
MLQQRNTCHLLLLAQVEVMAEVVRFVQKSKLKQNDINDIERTRERAG